MKYTQLGHTSLTVSKACSWVLANPAVDVAIIGARHPKQLSDTAPAADVELSDDALREVEMIMKDAVPRRAVA
jgi:aryl-alcohol dehydrogenase-like predicted oxidoreductase